MGEAQEAGEVDGADLKGDHERREQGGEPPRTEGESLDPEAVRFRRPLPKKGLAVEIVNFAGKEGAERQEGQHQGDVVQLRAVIADDQSGTTCGGCGATIARGHQVVGLPCGRQHAMHARCVVNALRRGGA